MASHWPLFAVLTGFKSGSTILLHEAGKHAASSSSITVLLGEFCKLAVSFLLLLRDDAAAEGEMSLSDNDFNEKVRMRPLREQTLMQRTRSTMQHIRQDISSAHTLKLGLVASLYVVQNNLFLWAASRLDPSFFQALWQLRIFMTAIFSRLILRSAITRRQWTCLALIVIGVLLVQRGTSMEATSLHPTKAIKKIFNTSHSAPPSSITLAIAALAGAGVLSGLAGVILEQILVKTDTNLWSANILLSGFSIIPAASIILFELIQSPSTTLSSFTMLGSSMWPWSATICHGTAGILCALITKKAGTIANNLTTALSIVLTFGCSSFLHYSNKTPKLSLLFVALGSILILKGSYVFQKQVALKKEEEEKGYIAISSATSSPRILNDTESAFVLPFPISRPPTALVETKEA